MCKTKPSPVRVLHVVSAMDRGGVETMLMNLYRQVDRSMLQFDFLDHRPDGGDYATEIEGLGGRIVTVPGLSECGPVAYVGNVRDAIKRFGPFAAVHMHTRTHCGLVALAARMAGVKKRICHAHTAQTGRAAPLQRRVFFAVSRALIRANATHYYACGRDAAEHLFGRRVCSVPGKVVMLRNAVDLAQFDALREHDPQDLRNELASSDRKILCHVGRFFPPKNHRFLLDLAAHMQVAGAKYILLLAGDGPLKPEIEERVANMGLSDCVKFLGVRSDIPRLLMAADVFVLPSLYEGLPMAMVEAQAAGLPCVISDSITEEVDMGLGLVRRVSLQAPFESWREAVDEALSKQDRPSPALIRNAFAERGYDAVQNVNHLYALYGVQVQ